MYFKKEIIALAIVFCMPVFAADSTQQDESLQNDEHIDVVVAVEEVNNKVGEQSDKDVNKVVEEIDTQLEVENKIGSYKLKVQNSLARQGKTHSAFVYSGTADITVDKNDPSWSAYRTMAIKEAMARARESYLQELNVSTQSSTLNRLANKSGMPPATIDDFRAESSSTAIRDKVIAAIGGKLDAELEDLGINPEEYKAAPPEKRGDYLKASIAEQTKRTAYGNLSGMFLIKTFEVMKDNGEGTVGVVMAMSLKKKKLLKALIDSKGNIQPDGTKADSKFTTISNYLVSKKDSLYLKSGTNIKYDELGYPFIISYGQAGVKFSTNSQIRSMERKVAKPYAINDAWANLARTYNLSGKFSAETSQSKSNTTETISRLVNNNIETTQSDTVSSLISEMTQMSKTSASIKGLTGVKIEYTWSKKHPITGKEIVGAVIVWHPVSVRNAIDLTNNVTHKEAEPNDADKTQSIHSAESEDMFDAADF
jgi:hypothetical protein